jgi:hypothetical protein
VHLHHDGIVDEEGEYVHQHDVVCGGKAEQQAQRVKGAVSQAIDLEGNSDNNGGNDECVPEAN